MRPERNFWPDAPQSIKNWIFENEEIDYFSEKKIEYIFNADSNFGMHKRDFQIALKLAENKNPQFLRNLKAISFKVDFRSKLKPK